MDKPTKTCRHCKGRVETCAECHRCEPCRCICTKCQKCRTKVPQVPGRYCMHCKLCKACDACRKRPHFSDDRNWPGIVGAPQRINTLGRSLGIELELGEWGSLENASLAYAPYTVAHDWSVKPSEREMVLHPLQGDRFLQGMFELSVNLAKHRAVVNDTCALHVHVGGGELSYWQLRRLLRMYAKLEGEIYDYLILPHRRDAPTVTHYCQMMTKRHLDCDRCVRFDQQYPGARRPLEDLQMILRRMDRTTTTSELKAEFLRMLYNLTTTPDRADRAHRPAEANHLQQRKGGRYEWCRYVGLNLHAWLYRGTVEWRMKEGTTAIDELICWPLWCGWFVETVANMSEKESKRYWNLTEFTERYMPRFLTEWIVRKIALRKAVTLS